MNDPIDNLIDPHRRAVLYYFGDLQYWKLPQIAADALEQVYDDDALRRLAGLINSVESDIQPEDIDSAFSEMGVAAPLAKDHARLVLAAESANKALHCDWNVFDATTQIRIHLCELEDPQLGTLNRNALERMAVVLRKLGVIATFFSLASGCARSPELVRPADVPKGAAYVSGGKIGGWWKDCAPGPPGRVVRCRIWNAGGLVLYDEEFLPYDGGPPPTDLELKIDPASKFGDGDRIYLINGRVLLPKSRFGVLKKSVDVEPQIR